LEEKAEAARKGGFFRALGSQATRDCEAARLYGEAAAQYKTQECFAEAAEAHVKQAECLEAANEDLEMTEAYKSACVMYSRAGDSKKGIIYNLKLAGLYEGRDRQRNAAKTYEEIAEIYLEREQIKDTTKMLEKARSCYLNANQGVAASGCRARIADVSFDHGDYLQAKETYEQIAQPVRGQPNHRSPSYYWRAIISHMAHEAKTTADLKTTPAVVDGYKLQCPNFGKGVTAHKDRLITALLAAFDASSTDMFEQGLADYKRMHDMPASEINALLIVKNQMTDPVLAPATQDAGQTNDSGDESDPFA
jgi:tetratricopeptide (TPR) repeat protein